MAMNNVWFFGGPLNGVQMAVENLRTPLLYAEFHPERMIDPDAADSDVTTHRYNLDTQDYEERMVEIEEDGAPAFYVHEEHQSVFNDLRHFSEVGESAQVAWNRLEAFLTVLASAVVEAIEFEESMMQAQAVMGDQTHTAPECEELPPHECCWPQGEQPNDLQRLIYNFPEVDPSAYSRAYAEGQDIHGYSTPYFDSGSGVSAEELVPGIEQALRDWAETKKRIKEEE